MLKSRIEGGQDAFSVFSEEQAFHVGVPSKEAMQKIERYCEMLHFCLRVYVNDRFGSREILLEFMNSDVWNDWEGCDEVFIYGFGSGDFFLVRM